MFSIRTTSDEMPSLAQGRFSGGPGWLRVFRYALPLLLLLVLTGCGGADNDEKAANDVVEGIPTASPQALNEIPQGIGEATLKITDGEFGVDELFLQAGEPTELHVVNNDDKDYQFQIGKLVAATKIPAGTTTDIDFTTPDAGTETGQLLGANDDTVLDEVRVTVQEAGGVSND